MKTVLRAAMAIAIAGLAQGCGTVGPTVGDVNVMLDCYFLPIDRGVEACTPSTIESVTLLVGTYTATLENATKKDPDFKSKLARWEALRITDRIRGDVTKSAQGNDENLQKLRILRGLYIYGYLSRLAHDEALTNAADARTAASSIVAPLRAGLATLQEIMDSKPDGPAAGFGHTYKVDVFYDGFAAVYEAQAATATRLIKWVESFASVVDLPSFAERVKEGARFAYQELKNRTFASALQYDLVDTAVQVVETNAKKAPIDDAGFNNAVKAAVAYINKYCGGLAKTAGLPDKDGTCLSLSSPASTKTAAAADDESPTLAVLSRPSG